MSKRDDLDIPQKLKDWNRDEPDGVLRWYGECFIEGCEERSAKLIFHFPGLVGMLKTGAYSTGEFEIYTCDWHHADAQAEVQKAVAMKREFMTKEEAAAHWRSIHSPESIKRYEETKINPDYYGKVKL